MIVQAPVAIDIRELRPNEIKQAAALTASGMRDNPLHVAVFGDDVASRERRLNALFSTVMPMVGKKAILIGAFQDGEIVGLAGIARPGQCQPTGNESLRMLLRLLLRLGPGSLKRMGGWMSTWRRRDPAEPHWHLGPVVVERGLQGQGIGSAVMEEVCARVDRMGGLLYLETDKPENVRFYERFGFEVIDEAPVLGTPNWFMKRSPQ